MNWEEVGAIGQVLGSIAVIITLAYLAVQVSHARREMQRSLVEGRGEVLRELYLTRATDPRLNGLIIKASSALGVTPSPFALELMERAGLTHEEAAAVGFELATWWQYRVPIIPYVSELPAMARREFESSARNTYGKSPLSRLWYQKMKVGLNPDAVRYIDNLLAQPN